MIDLVVKLFKFSIFVKLLRLPTFENINGGKIDQYVDIDCYDQIYRFFLLKDPAVINSLIAIVFIGTSCGLLGSFMVVRRMALIGDTLAHAILPGVVLGFFWTEAKSLFSVLVGAIITAFTSTIIINILQNTTNLKKDSLLAMVLSSFYSIGVCAITIIQKSNISNKSGIDKYLFGQASAISTVDLWLMGICSSFTLMVIYLFYRELLISSFDIIFSRTLGIYVRICHYCLMILLTITIVISLQAAGIILVTAMLITPSITAYILTRKFYKILQISVLIGISTGAIGVFFSFIGNNLPTGPCIVLCSGGVFLITICFDCRKKFSLFLRKKIFALWFINRTLGVIYHTWEFSFFYNNDIRIRDVMKYYTDSAIFLEKNLPILQKIGYIDILDKSSFLDNSCSICFEISKAGKRKSCIIIKKHKK